MWASVEEAITLLGEKKVITCEQNWATFGFKAKTDVRLETGYSFATLQNLSKRNSTGQSDWRLIFDGGLSFWDMRDRVGTSQHGQTCFYDTRWWLAEDQSSWASSKPSNLRYHMINFKGDFHTCSWEEQNIQITKVQGQLRANDRVFVQGLFALQKIHNEKLFQRSSHWGSLRNKEGHLTYGDFEEDGLLIRALDPLRQVDNVFACAELTYNFALK